MLGIYPYLFIQIYYGCVNGAISLSWTVGNVKKYSWIEFKPCKHFIVHVLINKDNSTYKMVVIKIIQQQTYMKCSKKNITL